MNMRMLRVKSLATGTMVAGTILLTAINSAFAALILPPMIESARTGAGLAQHEGSGEASSVFVNGNAIGMVTEIAVGSSQGPSAALVASLRNWNVPSLAGASVVYDFAVVAMPGFPIGAAVPVTVAADLATSVSLSGNLEGANVTADANIGIYTSSNFLNLFPTFFAREECSFEQGSDQNIPCVDIDNTIFVNGFVRANDSNQILLGVNEIGTGNAETTVDILASADPIIQIANALIPGTNINFRDAYTLEFSDGVTQGLGTPPSPMPEPSSVALLLVGLGGLLALPRVCRRGRGGPLTSN